MRLKTFVVAAVLAAASLAVAQTRSKSDSRSVARYIATERWEYLVVAGGNVNLEATDNPSMRKQDAGFAREAFPLERNMDKLGQAGWELVSTVPSPQGLTYYFKRRK